MRLPELPRFKRLGMDCFNPNARDFSEGHKVTLKTFSGTGEALYRGRCVGCERQLFQDATPDQRLTLGVHVYCAFDEFPTVPLCFECQSERSMYDALKARKVSCP